LATASNDGYAEIWDLKQRKSLYPPRKVVSGPFASYCLDERRIALVSGINGPGWQIEIWDLAADERLNRRNIETGTPIFGAVSNDRQWWLSPTSDGSAVLLENQTTGEESVPIETATWVDYAEFSNDGKLFVLGFLFGKGTVLETSTRKERKALAANLLPFRSACFSPDNRRLITTGDQEAVVRMWDIESGQLLISFNAPRSASDVAVMSPDGNVLLMASSRLEHESSGGGMCIRRAPSWDQISTTEDTKPD
jgi:WD40 repeat protein